MEAFAKVFELTRPEDIVHFFRDVHGRPARSAASRLGPMVALRDE
jgi:hypothetical protein